MHFDEGTVVVGHPFGHAAGAEEEGGQVPGGGVGFHGEVLLGLFAVGDQGFQGVHILFGDDGLVVVHEVAVVAGQRVGVQGVAGGGGGHGARVVVSDDGFSGLLAQLGQRAGLHQTGELVLREAVQVAAGFHVGDHVGAGIRFGYGFHRGVKGDARVVGLVEIVDLLFGQVHGLFSHPHLDVIGARQFACECSAHQGQRHYQRQHNCQ